MGVLLFIAAIVSSAFARAPGEPPYFTRYQHYELRRVVPARYSWDDFARLAPTPEALRHALFAAQPLMGGLFLDDERVVEELGEARLRVAAPSWAEFVAKAQPTFTWNEGDMVWVGADDDGRPLFVLDEAFLYAPKGVSAQWVLLDTSDITSRLNGIIEGRNIRAVAPLRDKAPEPNNNAGFVEEYAVSVGKDARFGEVFEIGWQCEMNGGSGNVVRLRHIYLLRDAAGGWHFLGEGPGNGRGRSGMTYMTYETTARVRWREEAASTLPLEILFRAECTESDMSSSEDDPVRREFVTYHDQVLSGSLRSKARRIGRPYLLTSAGDTFDTILDLLTSWSPNWNLQGEKRIAVRAMWRGQLRRLNPGLSEGEIAANTRIELLTYPEIYETMERRFSTAEVRSIE